MLLHYLSHCTVVLSLSGSESFPDLIEDTVVEDLKMNNREDLLDHLSATGSPQDVQEWQYNALVIAFWFMKYDEAAEWATKYIDLRGPSEVFLRLSDVYISLYEGLTAFQLAKRCESQEERNSWIEIVQRSIDFFEGLLKLSVWNWDNKHLLLQASMRFLSGDIQSATVHYQAAIKSANEHRFVHEEGLGYELLSDLYMHSGDIEQAKKNLASARICYEKWGAKAIIDLRAPVQD